MDESEIHHAYGWVLQALTQAFAERLKTIVLFGSRARGEARPESDHDLFVVIEDLPGDILDRNRLVRLPLLPVIAHLPGSISLVAKTPQEVDQNLTPLLFDVCLDGICLYGEAYFDPYRRRALAAKDQAGLHRKRIGGEWVWRFPKVPAHSWEITWQGYREYN
jgi:hypothetical protein